MWRTRLNRQRAQRPASRPRLEELESRLVPTVPTPDHVVIVIEENHSYNEIIGSSAAPYINSLASQGALMTNSFAVEHPSQPNYLDFFSGSNQGVTNDNTPPPGSPYSTANLGQELIAAGRTFGGYSEDQPSVGYTGSSSGNYVRKHNPWVDFSNVPSTDNMPYAGYFPTDYTQLPTVSIVVPNLLDDMHDGTIQQGDTWLQNNIDAYKQWAMTHNSLLIVTWDEDDHTQGNQIPTIFVGPMVTQGQYSEQINHFNVLRTIEDMYGLPYAGQSATANPIADIWASTPPAAPSNLAATAAAANQLNLGWTDNSSSETGILVERSTDDVNFTQIASLGSQATSYSDTGLTTGATYYYRVRAYNGAGDSAYSNTANNVAVGAAASFSVSAPGTATQGTSFNITVTALDSANDTVTFYAGTVHFTSSDTAASLPANSTLTNGTGTFAVTLNTTGSQTVTATDTANSSITGSATVSVSVSVPAAPSNLKATAAAANQINLAWTDNSSNESGFLIERSTDDVNFTQIGSVAADVTSYSDTGLTTGTTYYYRVRAYNASGDSAYSNTAHSVAVGAAASFRVSAPSTKAQGTAFNIRVTALDTAGDTVTFYGGTVHFTSSDSAAILPANSTLTKGTKTFSVTLETLGKQTVTATDTTNSSNTGSATVGVAPVAPSNLTATAVSSSQINLTWTDNSAGETGILVQRSTDGTHFTQIASLGGTATSYSSTGLSGQTKYYYRVRAYFTNPDGSKLYSAYSRIVTATTLSQPSAALLRGPSQTSTTQAKLQSEWLSFASLENALLSSSSDGRHS
jgi:hypothetical protein